jgi:triosephosphate isomerase
VTRKYLIAGNWKLNAGGAKGIELATAVAAATKGVQAEVVVAPPFTVLAAIANDLEGTHVEVAGQNLYPKDSGAFTGEISAPMLLEAGAKWVILGHSERRQYFGETDASVKDKVVAAMAANLCPIACIGETLAEREAGRTLDVVNRQLDAFLGVLKEQPGKAAIAYEPVWAIGTGKVATNEQAQEVHAALRKRLEGASPELSRVTRVLYGGSVKADNALGLLDQADIDGALVGGASLKLDSFMGIVKAARQVA